jgi:plasmid stabilization system protein ParE
VTVSLDPAAETDLDDYLGYVWETSRTLAVVLRQEARARTALARLAARPRIGCPCRDPQWPAGTRHVTLAKTPLVAFYVEVQGGLRVLRMPHGRRDVAR